MFRTLVPSLCAFGLGLLADATALAESEAHIELRGIVPTELHLEVEALTNATSLDLVKGERSTPIAQVLEFANSADGYTVLISSANDGNLVHIERPDSRIPYRLSYDRSTFRRPSMEPEVFKVSGPLDRPVRQKSSLRIQIDPSPDAMAGTYEDIVFIEMRAP